MKTTWSWSIDSELNRILQAAHNIGNGFYVRQGFHVHSDSHPYAENSVSIPPLPYYTIPGFWQKVRDVDFYTLPATDPHNLTQDLRPLLPELEPPQVEDLKRNWDQNSQSILELIGRELPTTKPLNSLTIYTTKFGTISSFNNSDPTSPEITLFLRQDATIYHLVEGIVSSLLRQTHIDQGFSWQESEAIIDHILTLSQLAILLKQVEPTPFQGTIQSLIPEQGQPNLEFLAQIQAPLQNPHLNIQDERPYINDRPIHHLTAREQKVLLELIKLQGKTLDYDTLSDLVFGADEDSFSLAVLSKVIERLRNKLEKNGVTGSLITTDRARGFFINQS
jgi:hypothetical protein